MKNMISGLSYGALNASYQVTGPAQSPPTARPLPSYLFDFPLTHTGLQKRPSPTLPAEVPSVGEREEGKDLNLLP